MAVRTQPNIAGFQDGGWDQGIQAASRRWERHGMESPLEPPEGIQSYLWF